MKKKIFGEFFQKYFDVLKRSELQKVIQEKFYCYILQSEVNQSFYIGHTCDLSARLQRHNKGYNKSTKAFTPWKLVYSETFQTKSQAQKREYQIKRKKSRKHIEWLILQTP